MHPMRGLLAKASTLERAYQKGKIPIPRSRGSKSRRPDEMIGATESPDAEQTEERIGPASVSDEPTDIHDLFAKLVHQGRCKLGFIRANRVPIPPEKAKKN